MKKLLLISTVITLITSSCDYFEKQKITGHYYLVSVDTKYSTEIDYYFEPDANGGATVVRESVFAVGYNEKYIVAKQHPVDNDLGSRYPNRKITNYFIIPIESRCILYETPLDEFQFSQEKIKLGIEDLQFTIIDHRLE